VGAKIETNILLPGETEARESGELSFIDNAVDQSTGNYRQHRSYPLIGKNQFGGRDARGCGPPISRDPPKTMAGLHLRDEQQLAGGPAALHVGVGLRRVR
jgi:hypothetical protein